MLLALVLLALVLVLSLSILILLWLALGELSLKGEDSLTFGFDLSGDFLLEFNLSVGEGRRLILIASGSEVRRFL